MILPIPLGDGLAGELGLTSGSEGLRSFEVHRGTDLLDARAMGAFDHFLLDLLSLLNRPQRRFLGHRGLGLLGRAGILLLGGLLGHGLLALRS